MLLVVSAALASLALARRRRICAWALFLPALSNTLGAVDGVTLIDQSHALAGGISPDDAPGFPVTISQSGSYRLSGNLTVPANTTAILITAAYVTLDLNGFSIVGPVVCTSSPAVCPAANQAIGIQAGNPGVPGPRGIRILHGSVRGMGSLGISISGEGSSVEGVTADGNAGGGILVAGNVVGCAANLNGALGIIAFTVSGSVAIENATDGIVLDAIAGVGTGNIASFNGRNGIVAPNGVVNSNTAVRNVGFGVSALCPATIIGNSIINNQGGSIQTTNSAPGAACVVVNNATIP